MSESIHLSLDQRSYDIHIGSGLLGDKDLVRTSCDARQVVIVTNRVVAPLYLDRLKSALAGLSVFELVIEDGEAVKTLETFGVVQEFLLTHGIERSACLVALGGGVVGDLAGFAAACYQRGIEFVQVPTTLLAQVDSSVGGKTAVNHPLGKNMIGAFYQPRTVLIDTDTLRTLPDRELSAGLAEVIKYGLIGDLDFLGWLEQNMHLLIERDTEALSYAIKKSCQAKAAIVSADEREKGQRALLNLGHTFGHAIEARLGYGSWLHGEAVAAGMCMAARMSQRLGWLDDSAVRRVESLLIQASLPTTPPGEISSDEFIEVMSRDKKNVDGRIRLILLRGLGNAVVSQDYDDDALRATLNAGQ